MLDVYKGFVEKYKNRVGIDRDITTWRRYKKSIEHLTVFIRKEYKESDILLNKLTESFIDDYLVFLRHDLGLMPMTVKGYIYCLKNVIYVAFNNGWMRSNPFASFKYSPMPPERMPIDETELRKIMAVKLQHRAQERTRDMFVFSCFTGVSYADMKSMTYEQIVQDMSGVWWLTGRRQKTEVPYSVRLLPVPLMIIEKYRGKTGSDRVFKLSEVKVMDKSLKIIATQSGVEKRLTFHVARHTFATTIALSNGVPLETLSKMLGHKHISTTQIYAKITNERINDAMTKLEDKLGDKYQFK